MRKHENDADRKWIETVSAELRPEPMDASRAARFRRTIEQRLEPGPWVAWRPAVALAVTVAAALWFAISDAPQPVPDEIAAVPARVIEDSTPAPVLQAFVDPDAYGDRPGPEDYLPEDYLVLASLLDADTETP